MKRGPKPFTTPEPGSLAMSRWAQRNAARATIQAAYEAVQKGHMTEAEYRRIYETERAALRASGAIRT